MLLEKKFLYPIYLQTSSAASKGRPILGKTGSHTLDKATISEQ